MKKVENERGRDGENISERKREKESNREATGRTERREGRLRPASHLSCVTTPCSCNTYIHIQDSSSISHTCIQGTKTNHINYHP